MIDLAGFYAAIANEGQRVTPYAIDSIEQNGHAGLSPRGRQADLSGRRRPRRVLSASHHPRRRGGARHRRLDPAALPASSAARPAPRTTRTTPGSSASPTTSPSRSGSATTTPRGKQDARPAARPAADTPCRSPSRSSRPTWQYHAPKTPLPPPSAEAARGPQGHADRRLYRTEGQRPLKTPSWSISASAGGKVRDTQHALVGAARVVAQRPHAASGRRRAHLMPAIAGHRRTLPGGRRGRFGNCSDCSVSEREPSHTNRPRSNGLICCKERQLESG